MLQEIMGDSTLRPNRSDDNGMNGAQTDDTGWTAPNKKQCHTSGSSFSSQSTLINAPHRDLTVINEPEDPTKLITKRNPLAVSEKLYDVAPRGVAQI